MFSKSNWTNCVSSKIPLHSTIILLVFPLTPFDLLYYLFETHTTIQFNSLQFNSIHKGLENNCKIAEFLAIDDNDYQHKRLVRHYKRLGLNVIRYVGEDISNIPDRLIWGGVGTLMNAKIVTLLEKWSPTFLQIQTKEE